MRAHSNAALDRHAYPEGARVLDVGCGFGDSTRLIAKRVGPRGEAVGVDCAENFISASARRRRGQAGIANASYFVADVQTDDLRGPYDFAFSRFGTMFFMMPGAAMRNIRKALKPGGELTMIVWRRREENPWLHDAELQGPGDRPGRRRTRTRTRCIADRDRFRWPARTWSVRCCAAPASTASPSSASTPTSASARTCTKPSSSPWRSGPAGEIIRLAGEEGAERKDAVAAALHETLARYSRSDGVWGPSSTWFVTARNP